MNCKYSFVALSIFSAITFSPKIMATTFCGSRSNVVWGGTENFEGKLTADDCLEIGADEFGTAGTGINMDLQDGSRLSVLGYLKDSNVNSGAEVYIHKTAKIAIDGYNENAPALASNINVNTGGLVRVLDGGTLENSQINGGTVYVSNTGATDNAGLSIKNTINEEGKLYTYSGGISQETIINNKAIEYVQQSGKSISAEVNNGGSQILRLSGLATGAIVRDGGLQQVGSDSIAESSEIEAGGIQYVINTGTANNTSVRGTQYIFQSESVAGTATNTKLYDNGIQNVQQGGKAIGVELFDTSVQVVLTGSLAQDVIINDNARSWVAAGGQILNTTVNNQGQLQLVAAEGTSGAYADAVNLNGKDTSLFIIANTNDADSVSIQHLEGNGNVMFKTAAAANRNADNIIFSRLNVDNLAGNMHFFSTLRLRMDAEIT